MKILLAEDDKHLGSAIIKALKSQNPHYTIEWAKNGLEAKTYLQNSNEIYDLAILDINMPFFNGFEVLKAMRDNKNNTPVFFLTSRSQLEDKVKGLDLGADDYILKPFDIQELIARIRSIQRRVLQKNSNVISFNNISLDTKSYTITINNEPCAFSKNEYKILLKLIANPNKIVSKESIAQSVYQLDQTIESNAIEVHIHNIRKRLPKNIIIKSARGIGYMLLEATK